MDTELKTRRHNLATLRRCMADIDALNLPGDYDLQQAVRRQRLAQLRRNAHGLQRDAERRPRTQNQPGGTMSSDLDNLRSNLAEALQRRAHWNLAAQELGKPSAVH
jgi:DNA-binding TFAR19-related protein (PDSD5 family)